MITRYVWENPWPLGVFLVLLTIGLLLVWNHRRERLWGLLSGVTAVLSVLVFLGASWVTTAGERARELVAEMVRSAETGDIDGVLGALAPDATLHLESLKRPGRPFEQLAGSIRSLEGSNRITENRVTRLRAWTVDSEEAIVALGCRTTTVNSWGPVPTRWVFRVEASPDGAFRVTRVAFESLAGRAPTDVLR